MRRPARLMLGALPFELYTNGRVLVTLPAAALPFGVTLQATAVYPTLGAFLASMRRSQ
jgi:hypothetical protein